MGRIVVRCEEYDGDEYNLVDDERGEEERKELPPDRPPEEAASTGFTNNAAPSKAGSAADFKPCIT